MIGRDNLNKYPASDNRFVKSTTCKSPFCPVRATRCGIDLARVAPMGQYEIHLNIVLQSACPEGASLCGNSPFSCSPRLVEFQSLIDLVPIQDSTNRGGAEKRSLRRA
jgi:hypothetical protein